MRVVDLFCTLPRPGARFVFGFSAQALGVGSEPTPGQRRGGASGPTTRTRHGTPTGVQY